MRKFLLLLSLPLFALSACSGSEESQTAKNEATANMADVAVEATADASATASQASALPKIGPETAPNLAFEYSYAFKLPDKNIGAVQQEHAEACAMLGSARCQVVDMKFEQNDDDVQAMLALKLDPSIAFKFGRDAVAAVEKADGELANGNVAGSNVGGEIEDSQGRSAMLQGQLDRLEKRLAAKGLPAKERVSLQDRVEELRQQLDQEQAGRQEGEARLALTPVRFTYTSDGGVPGFGKSSPFANAWAVSTTSFAAMINFVLLAFGLVAPWALLLFLIIWLVRSPLGKGLRGWWSKNSPDHNSGAQPPAA